MQHNHLTPIFPNAGVDEILEVAGLNWEVELCPRYYSHNDQYVQVPDQYSLIRTDEPTELTTAPQHWHPIQNRDIVETFHTLITQANLKFTHAGAMNDGRHICLIADLGKKWDVKKVGDIVRCDLQLIGSHQCGVGHRVNLLTERLVCSNGMTRKVTSKLQVIRHNEGTANELNWAMGAALSEWEKFTEDCDSLADTPISEQEAALLLVKAFGEPGEPLDKQPKVIRAAIDLFSGNLIGGHYLSAYRTAYGLLQSVTEYYNHSYQFRRGTDALSAITMGAIAGSVSRFERSLLKYSQKVGVSAVNAG